MKKLGKVYFKKLSKFEKHLSRGYKGDYTYGVMQSDFDDMYKIYQELGGTERFRYTCGSCILRLTKELGKIYFEYKENEEKDE